MLVFILFLSPLLLTVVFLYILSKQEKEKIEFFHVMAHRFRSPISVIKWYIELLSGESAGNLNDKQKKYLAEVYNSCERLNGTIESLVVFLQLQSNNLVVKEENVNIKDLLDKIIQKLQFKIQRHKLHLQQDYPSEEVHSQTDPKLLSIAAQNLLENAVKYSPENGNINIKMSISNRKVMLEIKSEGLGIPAKVTSKMLASSVYSKEVRFSLYLTRLILKKIGADVSFKSEENKGTTFFISLPA